MRSVSEVSLHGEFPDKLCKLKSDLNLETQLQLTPVFDRFNTVRLVSLSNTLQEVVEKEGEE